MVAQVKPVESQADMLFRLLQKARAEGVEILTEGDSETKFATSGTCPGIVYAVSELGCSCQGFRSFGRCKHYSAYLEHLGQRPPTAAEVDAIRAEWIRMKSLFDRHHVKSTADWRDYQSTKRAYERAVDLADISECGNCGGVGTIDQKDRDGNRWTVTCPVCHGLRAATSVPVAMAAD